MVSHTGLQRCWRELTRLSPRPLSDSDEEAEREPPSLEPEAGCFMVVPVFDTRGLPLGVLAVDTMAREEFLRDLRPPQQVRALHTRECMSSLNAGGWVGVGCNVQGVQVRIGCCVCGGNLDSPDTARHFLNARLPRGAPESCISSAHGSRWSVGSAMQSLRRSAAYTQAKVQRCAAVVRVLMVALAAHEEVRPTPFKSFGTPKIGSTIAELIDPRSLNA